MDDMSEGVCQNIMPKSTEAKKLNPTLACAPLYMKPK